MLAPVLALILVLGIYPKLLTSSIDPSTKATIAHVQPTGQTTDVGQVRATGATPLMPTPQLVLQPVLPEMILCAAAIVGMLYEAFARRSERSIHLAIALVGVAGAAAAAYTLWNWTGAPFVLGDTVAADRFAALAAFVLLGAARVRVPLLRPLRGARSGGLPRRVLPARAVRDGRA